MCYLQQNRSNLGNQMMIIITHAQATVLKKKLGRNLSSWRTMVFQWRSFMASSTWVDFMIPPASWVNLTVLPSSSDSFMCWAKFEDPVIVASATLKPVSETDAFPCFAFYAFLFLYLRHLLSVRKCISKYTRKTLIYLLDSLSTSCVSTHKFAVVKLGSN